MVYIAFSYLSLISLGFIDNARGPIYPELLNFFQISKSQGALFFSLASLSSFAITIPSKYWLRTLGATRATQLALLIDGLFCFGLSMIESQQYYLLLILACVFGVSLGIKSISMNLLITQHYQGANRRRVFAGLHSMYGIASLLAPLFVQVMYYFGIPWNQIFLYMGWVPLLTLVGFSRLKSDTYLQKETLPSKLQWIDMLTVSLPLALYVASEIIVSSRLVLFLQEERSFDSSLSNWYLTLYFCCLLAGRLLFSAVNFKFSNLSLLITSVIFTSILMVLGLWSDPLFLCFTGLSMSFFFPCAMDFISSSFDQNSQALLSRSMQMVGASLVSFHFIFGQIASASSVFWAFTLPLVLSLIVLALLISRRALV